MKAASAITLESIGGQPASEVLSTAACDMAFTYGTNSNNSTQAVAKTMTDAGHPAQKLWHSLRGPAKVLV